jgi:pyruvate formate-lyase/glycerol dehydratase family glycyl radical enzyme
MTITARAVEELNQVVAMTERVARLKKSYLGSIPQVCSERTRLLTESWKETEGEPIAIRRAKAFHKILEGIPIAIRDNELIVGSHTRHVRGCYAHLEYNCEELVKELEAEKLTVTGDNVPGDISQEDKKQLLADADYWKNRSVSWKIDQAYKELWGTKAGDYRESRLWYEQHNKAPSGRVVDFEPVLTKGLEGIIDEIETEIAQIKGGKEFTPQHIHKLNFLQAGKIACEALMRYAQRHYELARGLAAKEVNPIRKKELERIAQNCLWVPAKPARDFYEALQSYWFIFLAENHEVAALAQGPGRLDQYIGPFYINDIKQGILTRQEAAELLGCLFIKWVETESFKIELQKKNTQGSEIMNLCIGGVKANGQDASNELTYLLLEVARQVKVRNPHISFRYHDGMGEELLLKAAETARDTGAGIPAFFNDKSAVLGLVRWGLPISDARNWSPQGCVERYPHTTSQAFAGGAFFSLSKCLELALNDGIDPRTGKRLGPPTGDATNFATFDEVYEAFKKQVGAAIEFLAQSFNIALVIRAENYRLPFISILTRDCIQSGLDTIEGGARYGKQFLAAVRPFGHQNTVNSLAAIKKVVFEDKATTMPELLDALKANFGGYEELHHKLLSAPKWGNDDDYVDTIMQDLFSWTESMIKQQRNPWGYQYTVSRQGLTLNYVFGHTVGALADGRKAWEPLADGSVSAMRGTDVKGITAVINSASKLDAIGSEATLLNLKLHPSALQSKEGLKKLLSLIKTYFDSYGHHVQFNVVNRETLLDAQKHPEKYRDLLIRVAGFSAFFVELSLEVQNEIIARTEHTLG